jgi:hypothetical protein
MRVLWRERLVDGTVGPWHEALAPRGGVLRAIWNPTKRLRKVVFDCKRKLERAGENRDDELFILSVQYLMLLRHVVDLPASALGAARQLALVKTQGADDDEDGLFELLFVGPWHALPGVDSEQGLDTSRLPEPLERVV